MRVLVLYATSEGQTEKIARHIARGLADRDIPVDRHNIADESVVAVSLDAYDAVVVGSPMHYSHYDVRLADYLQQYKSVLNDIPSAFFSVSLGILSNKESEKLEVKKITDSYLNDTHWHPVLQRHFAGALAYSKYNWIMRHVMHWIARKAGAQTDMRYDYEFTDWPQVDEFVQEFVELIESCREPEDFRAHRSPFSEPARPYSLRYRQAANVQHTSHGG